MYATKNIFKKLIISVCALVLLLSVNTLAEGGDKIDISDYKVFFEEAEHAYTGEEIKPEIKVAKADELGNAIEESVLTKDEDYTVSYTGNINAGEEAATATVTGVNDYTGSIEGKFSISKASFADAMVKLSDDVYTYNGKSKTPEVTVEFNGKTIDKNEYTVRYSNNVNAGNASVEVTADSNNFEGTATSEFVIEKAALKDAKITLSKTSYVYDGNYKKPTVTVKIDDTVIETANYTVKYSNNKSIGTGKVTVTAAGNNLTGTKNVSFKIVPKTPVISLSRAYGEIEISWNRVSNADGYQIYRSKSPNSGFTCIKGIADGSTLSHTNKNVTHNVRYYYKVRAYKTVNGTKVYSDFSTVKNILVRVEKAKIEKISRVDYNSLEIKWESVKGATGYRVYRSKTKNGEYLSVATLAGNGTELYQDDGLVCGRTYYYKVRAYRKIDGVKYFGDYSNAKSNYTCPEKVKLTDGCTYEATKAVLKWEKSSGADGYEIYRSNTKNGTYKKIKTISNKNTLTFTNTKLTKSKDYYYKVRAYRKVDGKTVYGSFSGKFRKEKGGWRYSTFLGEKIKYYYNGDNERVTDVSQLIGKQDSYVIKVNKQRATVTVYAKDGDNGYIIPVKAFVCSPGYSTPEGTFHTQQKLRWHELMGPCWGQWNTRISGSYLFHSVFYNSYNNSDALSVTAYNKLGLVCSHGCVRLTAGDAKWIYDNCELGTKVIIYNSSTSGPFGKPSAPTLPYWHTWDPTDPNKYSKCDSYGCH